MSSLGGFESLQVDWNCNSKSVTDESWYNFVDLTPKMKLMWWDKILLSMTLGKTEEKAKALSLSETINFTNTLSPGDAL